MIWNIGSTPAYGIYAGERPKRTCKFLEKATQEKIIGTKFKGKPVYKGKTKARVFIIHSKNDFKRILSETNAVIVAKVIEMDDIRVLKTKRVRGIITEEGGITSHIAITGRELKVPIVIGVKNITRVLKDNDLVEVDADKGVVRILKRK